MKYDRNIFYAPYMILHFAVEAEAKHAQTPFLSKDDLKQIQESKSVALMLFGININTGVKHWLQLTDPKDGTPDIRTIRRYGNGETETRAEQAVEVVTLEKHSAENIADFLLRTKLSDSKKYPDNMNILCAIDRPTNDTFRNIFEGLKQSKKLYPVFVLGRVSTGEEHVYSFAQVNPVLDRLTVFDAIEEAKKVYKDHAIIMIRGKKPENPSEQKELTNPFLE